MTEQDKSPKWRVRCGLCASVSPPLSLSISFIGMFVFRFGNDKYRYRYHTETFRVSIPTLTTILLLCTSTYELLDPVLTSCWTLRPMCSVFDPTAFRHCTTSPSVVVLCVSLELCPLPTGPGRMLVYCGSWIRWLVSRIRNCVDKLGGDWEGGQVQRTAKRYDDDGDVKDVELSLLLLAAVITAARVLPPQTNRCRRTMKRGTGRQHSQLCFVYGYRGRLCAFKPLIHTK